MGFHRDIGHKMITPVHEMASIGHEVFAKFANSPYPLLNGAPMEPKLYEFCTALNKVVPEFVFYGSEYNGHEATPDTVRCRTVRVAINQDYTVGVLGWDASEDKYYIFSPLIENDAYKTSNSFYHSMRTATLARAVRTAAKYLRPLTMDAMADVTAQLFSRNLENWVSEARDKSATKFGKFSESMRTNRDALRHTVMMGLPLDNDIAELAKEWFAASDLYESVHRGLRPSTFAVIKVVGGKQYVDAIEVHDMHKHIYRIGEVTVKQVASHLPIEEAPEILIERLSVLSITEYKQFVPEVGMRVSEHCFWVI